MIDRTQVPNPAEVALEAGISGERAASLIAASWHLAEAYTGRSYALEAGAHVILAVRNLALCQAIHDPARTEFRSITAGDSQLSRTTMQPLFKMSGAGILLASEVIWGTSYVEPVQEI